LALSGPKTPQQICVQKVLENRYFFFSSSLKNPLEL
jgi:hypothetical protein